VTEDFEDGILPLGPMIEAIVDAGALITRVT